jgi:VWFA-related protein
MQQKNKAPAPTAASILEPGRVFRRLRAPLALGIAISGIWTASVAQERSANLTPRTSTHHSEKRDGLIPSLRTDVNRVLTPVMVTDSYGRKAEGLHKEDFKIFQDGVEQPISEFSSEQSPVSIGIVLDCSNSMTNKIDTAKKMLGSLLRLSLPGDEFFLITVHDQPELLQGFTSKMEAVEHEMTTVPVYGWTALFDAMYMGINHEKRAKNTERALVVLTDGGDNNSRYTESELRREVREADVRIYSISVVGNSSVVEKLAEESGGRAFHAKHINDLPELAGDVSDAIHGQYVLGYAPTITSRDGKYHSVKVQVTQPTDGTRYRLAWRHGYFAPLQ